MSRNVCIIGTGMTKFGENFDKSLRDMMAEALWMAIDDSKVDPKDIQAGWFGSAGTGLFAMQDGDVPSTVADCTGFTPLPVTRIESACASSSDAVRQAFYSIKSGIYDIVFVLGTEKMTDIGPTRLAMSIIGRGLDTEIEYPYGITAPGLYAMFATRHMHEFGTTREQLASVAVKNHKYGARNPKAYLRFEVALEKALRSPMVAYPLTLFDCCTINDGSAAVILCSEDIARKYTDTPIKILASCNRTDFVSPVFRSLTEIKAAALASKDAFKMAGVGPDDIDVAEVHDCFTIAEIMAYEDLGFCKKGEGGKFVQEGQSEIGGKVPVNVSGGLKAKGHPTGATGVAQICELVWQLKNEVESNRQVPNAEIGLSHNVGGTGGVCQITIVGR